MKFSNLKKSISIVFLSAFFTTVNLNCLQVKMVINQPVADLRTKPQDPPAFLEYPIFYNNNPLQDTQLLLGEHVLVLEENNGWLKVQALEQRKFYASQGWTFQTGYIKAEHATAVDEFEENNIVVKKQWANIHEQPSHESDTLFTVSIGTKLLATERQDDWYIIKMPDGRQGAVAASNVYQMEITVQESIKQMREKLVQVSKGFRNAPYSWGGRSAFNPNKDRQTGVDCSSFVNLVYRANGLQIPRDARDQFMMSKPIEHGSNLQPGDLIFFATPERPDKIHHTLMYLGQGVMIESTGSKANYENQIAYEIELLGQQLSEIRNGQVCSSSLIDKQIVYFGTYLGSREQMQTLRLKELYTPKKKIILQSL